MDIDLLGRTGDEETGIVAQIRDILGVEVQPDGLIFDPASIRNDRITRDAEHDFKGSLGTARIHMQIDVGFGDAVFPEPEAADLPAMLDFPAPRMLCCSRESAVAEKLEAMVQLGVLNSRMKDFYDIWLLSRQFDFDGPDLSHAVRLTFERRGTAMPAMIEAFTRSFADDKQVQWSAFRNRLQQEHIPASFAEIVVAIDEFLSPVVAALVSGDPSPTHWTASGAWT